MSNLTEIRWHARGGQGAVTAAKTLAEMALTKDMYFQAFPEYGPERMGAPIQCFNRISKEPISLYCSVTNPSIVVVVDPTLLEIAHITTGLEMGGTIIINNIGDPKFLKKQYSLQDYQVYSVDATGICMATLGRFIPNVPMLGALLKITGMISLEEAQEFLLASFSKKFAANVAEKNVEALTRAYKEVKGE